MEKKKKKKKTAGVLEKRIISQFYALHFVCEKHKNIKI